MKKLLQDAIDMLVERDMHLLRVDANERTITNQLACYLKVLIPEYDVDCEYNRNYDTVKTLESHGFTGSNIAPDIIVHRRGTNTNILVIEAKNNNASQNDKEDDRNKLRALVSDLGYQHAAFIILRTGTTDPGIDQPEWISD